MVIANKKQSFALYDLGAFGNQVRQWNSWKEVEADPYVGLIVMRSKRGGGGPCVYDIPKDQRVVENILLGPEWDGHREFLFFNQAIPVNRIVLNCEAVMLESFPDLHVFYGTGQVHMRTALRSHPRHADGLEARRVLGRFLDESSLVCLWGLLEKFPEHVVEFTTLDCGIGSLGWNTIFWEVRKY